MTCGRKWIMLQFFETFGACSFCFISFYSTNVTEARKFTIEYLPGYKVSKQSFGFLASFAIWCLTTIGPLPHDM